MAKFTLLPVEEPVFEQPELAVPAIVAVKGYETARNIGQIYDAYNQPSQQDQKVRTGPHQPFLRGSPLPLTPSHYQAPSSGGVVQETQPLIGREQKGYGSINDDDDDLPRDEDGNVNYGNILGRLGALGRRMER